MAAVTAYRRHCLFFIEKLLFLFFALFEKLRHLLRLFKLAAFGDEGERRISLVGLFFRQDQVIGAGLKMHMSLWNPC